MKAQDIINHLHELGTWVNWRKTRDIVLAGDPDIEVEKIATCWMMTNKVIQQAITAKVNFIICHETPYYEASTEPYQIYYQSANRKRKLLAQHNICVFRCHDVLDRLPEVGIPDSWGQAIGLPFKDRPVNSFYKYAEFEPTSVTEIAKKVAKAVTACGQDAVQVFGDPQRLITSLAIGTGAITNIDDFLKLPVEAVVFSEDGCKSYQDIQYCLDNNIAAIRVNHSACEVPGMRALADYLQKTFNIPSQHLAEGFDCTTVFPE